MEQRAERAETSISSLSGVDASTLREMDVLNSLLGLGAAEAHAEQVS